MSKTKHKPAAPTTERLTPLTISLPGDLLAQVEDISHRDRRSLAAVVRDLVSAGLIAQDGGAS